MTINDNLMTAKPNDYLMTAQPNDNLMTAKPNDHFPICENRALINRWLSFFTTDSHRLFTDSHRKIHLTAK